MTDDYIYEIRQYDNKVIFTGTYMELIKHLYSRGIRASKCVRDDGSNRVELWSRD